MSTSAEARETPRSSFVRRVLIVVAIVGTVLLFVEAVAAAAQIFLVLFGGILFGVFLNGVGRLLTRTGVTYRWALTTVVVLLLGLVGAMLTLAAQQISDRVDQFVGQSQEAIEQVQEKLGETPLGRRILNRVEPAAEKSLAADNVRQIGSMARTAVEQVLFFLGAAAIVFFTGLYLAADPERYRRGLVSLLPPSRRPRAHQAVEAVGETLWRWLLGQFAGMTIIGVTTAVGLSIMGVPMAPMLGVIAFFLEFVPNFGPISAMIPQSLFAFQAGGMQLVLYVVIFNIVLQVVESYLIMPLIQQYEIRLPAALIIGVQVVLGYIAGVLGLLFATPLAAAVMVLVQMLYIEDVLGDTSAAPDVERSEQSPQTA